MASVYPVRLLSKMATSAGKADSYTSLCQVDQFHLNNQDDWKFFKQAYDGGSEFIKRIITRNPRESAGNFKDRITECFYFNYAATIIGLYSFAIMEQEPSHNLGALSSDEAWKLFVKNVDLFGTDFKDFIDRSQITASIFGTTGVLVSKPPVQEKVPKQYELDNNIYPYLTKYSPDQILESVFERNPINHRIELAYIRLKDIDGRIQEWSKTHVMIWAKPIESSNNKKISDTAICSYSGINPLGEIPFVFMKNLYNENSISHGLSDLREIAAISGSIIRDTSIGTESLKNAGFPMMRKPKLKEGDDEIDESGPTAILEFDSADGEAGKPDWLKPEIRDTIISTLEWIDRKVDEIYRVSFLSGMHNQAKGTQVTSGVALRYELKQLTSVLTQKTKSLSELELGIMDFWLKWQNQTELKSQIHISRPIDFTMDELSTNANLITASLDSISSDEYNKQAQLKIVSMLLPGLSKDAIKQIYAEIKSTRDEILMVKLKDTNHPKYGVQKETAVAGETAVAEDKKTDGTKSGSLPANETAKIEKKKTDADEKAKAA